MNNLIEESMYIDVIVTSPPYNIKKKYFLYKDDKKRSEYLLWIRNIAEKSNKILKEDGSFFLNINGTTKDPLLPFHVADQFLIDKNFTLQNTIHWIKSISLEKDDVGKKTYASTDFSVGHFRPMTSKRYLNDLHEYIFHFTKKGNVRLDKLAIGVSFQDKSNIKRWKSNREDKRDRGNVWFIPYETIREERPHPAVFPKKLPYLCIKLHGIQPDMIIYDPFMGIGTTALACLDLNINFIGTEIDKEYVKIAMENIHINNNYQRI